LADLLRINEIESFNFCSSQSSAECPLFVGILFVAAISLSASYSFMRSRHAERQGKSPRELMTGHGHPHWLTLLGLGPPQPLRA